jgi:hypothetical protein
LQYLDLENYVKPTLLKRNSIVSNQKGIIKTVRATFCSENQEENHEF